MDYDYDYQKEPCDEIISKSTLIGYFIYDNLIRCFYHYNDLPLIYHNITHINYYASTFIQPNNCKELKYGVFISDLFIDKFILCEHIVQNGEYEHLLFDDMNYSMKIDDGIIIIISSIHYAKDMICILTNVNQSFVDVNLTYIEKNL